MKHIIVVDDDPDIAEVIALVLSEEGYMVTAITEPSQAYERIAKEKPQLVLLDVLMSGIDGRDLCFALKNNPLTRGIVVVMVSAHPTAKNTIHVYKANDFLAKPFSYEELLRIVRKYM